MPTIIDPPVGPYSSREAIIAWIEELQRMPVSDEVLAAIEQAEAWIALSS